MVTACLLAGALLSACAAGGAAEAPTIHREDIEWCNIWVPSANRGERPRVLLIGDSISMGYYDEVARLLGDRAYVARMSTSAAIGDPALLDQVRLVIGHYRFDVVHLNVGLHGMDYGEDAYRAGLPGLIRLIRSRAPRARLIWATSTPWRRPAPRLSEFHENNERVRARNRISSEFAASRKLPVDDLYALVEGHPEYWADDGVHFNARGCHEEARQVAEYIGHALPAPNH